MFIGRLRCTMKYESNKTNAKKMIGKINGEFVPIKIM